MIETILSIMMCWVIFSMPILLLICGIDLMMSKNYFWWNKLTEILMGIFIFGASITLFITIIWCLIEI